MTLQEFAQMFAPLALQLQKTDADEAMIRAYFMALKDVQPEFLAMAAQRMAKRGGAVDSDNRHWFPKTSEWLECALKIEQERIGQQREILRKLRSPLCQSCDDTGWEPCGDGVRPCACRNVRRAEVLGRRPWPALPEAKHGDAA